MEVEVSVEELRKRKLMVCTPMYGGMCAGTYTKSSTDLAQVAAKYGVEVVFFYLFNESLITRARNYCADEFMRSDCTHMIFLDSDIGFDYNDVLAMLALMGEDTEYDIMCAPYPKKTIAWEKIKDAVDKGYADENPNVLENFVGDFVLNPAAGTTTFQINAPVEVLEGGTGFMMIQKRAFEKFDQAYPQMTYMPDHVRTKNFDGSREIMCYFDALIDDKNTNVVPEVEAFFDKYPEGTKEELVEFLSNKTEGIAKEKYSNRYLSEDYMFCQWARKAGVKVWMCPWMRTTHMGSYFFGGSLAHLAQVGASPTVDFDKLDKVKR